METPSCDALDMPVRSPSPKPSRDYSRSTDYKQNVRVGDAPHSLGNRESYARRRCRRRCALLPRSSNADGVARPTLLRVSPFPPLVRIWPIEGTSAVRRWLCIIRPPLLWRRRRVGLLGEGRVWFLPAGRSCFWIGLYPSSERPHHCVFSAGVVENTMTAVYPSTVALNNFLAGYVFFAATGVGEHIDKVIRHL